MRRTLTTKIAVAGGAAALALGAAACEVEPADGGDPALQDPMMDDGLDGGLDDGGLDDGTGTAP